MRYGYARCSTLEQDLTIQHEALTRAGCTVIRQEKMSGTTTRGRTELAAMMEFMREGDTLVVTRIDRLARSIPDLYAIVTELASKGAGLQATEQPIDTSTAAGKAFLGMLAVFAEFETNLRRERQMEGIAKAKANGVYKGRKRRISADEIRALEQTGLGPAAIARELKCSRASIYRVLGESEAPFEDF